MKKGILFVLALSLSALVGCGGNYKVPTSEFEKVKTAFNGVEKSFKKNSQHQKYKQQQRLNAKIQKYRKRFIFHFFSF